MKESISVVFAGRRRYLDWFSLLTCQNHIPKICYALDRIWMTVAKHLPLKFEYFHFNIFSLVVPPLLVVHRRKRCHTPNRIWITVAEYLPPKFEYFYRNLLSLVVPTLGVVRRRKVYHVFNRT